MVKVPGYVKNKMITKRGHWRPIKDKFGHEVAWEHIESGEIYDYDTYLEETNQAKYTESVNLRTRLQLYHSVKNFIDENLLGAAYFFLVKEKKIILGYPHDFQSIEFLKHVISGGDWRVIAGPALFDGRRLICIEIDDDTDFVRPEIMVDTFTTKTTKSTQYYYFSDYYIKNENIRSGRIYAQDRTPILPSGKDAEVVEFLPVAEL